MGEEFKRAIVKALIRQEKRIAMLEMTVSNLLHYLSEEKEILSDSEIDDLFDSAERLTELEVRDRIEEASEAFGLTVH